MTRVPISSDRLIGDINDARVRAKNLVHSLTADQLARRPDPAAWSIVECLSHLNSTAAVIQPKIAAAIERGKKNKVNGQGPFAPGPLGRLLIWLAEPPPKFRMRAPKNIAPRVAHPDAAETIGEFMKVQDLWERLVQDSDGLDQEKLKIGSPFRGIPRLRLAAPIPWMMAHQRRHLLQAEKVKQRIEAIDS
jgi:DinB superfamily